MSAAFVDHERKLSRQVQEPMQRLVAKACDAPATLQETTSLWIENSPMP